MNVSKCLIYVHVLLYKTQNSGHCRYSLFVVLITTLISNFLFVLIPAMMHTNVADKFIHVHVYTIV